MTNNTIDLQLDNERRYMALLALTAQTLPAKSPRNANWINQDLRGFSSEQWQLLYQQLDGDPEALELFLRRERQAHLKGVAKDVPTLFVGRRFRQWMAASSRDFAAWVFGPRLRYATGFGLIALVATLIVLQQMPRSSFTTKVEQAFAGATVESRASVDKLVLPWEHPPSALGFAAGPRNDSVPTHSFATGLLRGKQRLQGINAPVAVANDNSIEAYAALGEWNVLLWAKCEAAETPSRDFWQQQKTLAQELAAADYAVENSEAISKHLSTAIEMLEALASGDNVKRSARRLADELTRFREEIAPSAPDASNRAR